MKALARWPDPATDLLDALAATRPPMRRARPRIVKAYRWYEANAPELGGAVPAQLSASAAKAFLRAYRGAAQIEQLRKNILKAARFCPYCGIDIPYTLDHYVPKASFPEYAVYPDNLIPCCGECNLRRGDRWLDGGKRLHVNMYFDRISAVRILLAHIQVKDGSVDVTYRIDPARGAGKFMALYVRHVGSLKLLGRFRQRAGMELEEWEIKLKRNRYGAKVGPAALRQELRRDAAAAEQLHGVNHWLTALRCAASESVDFIEYLCA